MQTVWICWLESIDLKVVNNAPYVAIDPRWKKRLANVKLWYLSVVQFNDKQLVKKKQILEGEYSISKMGNITT